MPIDWNEISSNANGGTELMLRSLERHVDPELLEKVQIIPSRVRELDTTRHRILYLHDLPGDPESDAALENDGWRRFHRLVFVSHWQMRGYLERYNIDWGRCVVLHNAIEPIPVHRKPLEGPVRLTYFSTPQRGLEILIPVFRKLREDLGDSIELDVFSSFDIYGWTERNEAFERVYDMARKTEGINYSPSVSNDEIRKYLETAHVLAYPCIWPETSCRVLMEAMSAGLWCVHPNYGALPETAANWTQMYNWRNDLNEHANVFYGALRGVLQSIIEGDRKIELMAQKSYTDLFYGWEHRKRQWNSLIRDVTLEPLPVDDGEMFHYKIN